MIFNFTKMVLTILVSGYLCWAISEFIDFMQGKKTNNEIYKEIVGLREDLQMFDYEIFYDEN